MKENEIERNVQSAMQTVKGLPWMVAVWVVRDGRLRLVNRSTWRFPTGDFDAAIDLLTTDLNAERAQPVQFVGLPTDPLPLAMLGGVGFDRGNGSSPVMPVVDDVPALRVVERCDSDVSPLEEHPLPDGPSGKDATGEGVENAEAS